jgi:creatinine amidohydrolase
MKEKRMTDSIWLQDLTWEEVKRKIAEAEGTIIVPVGSTEQHGPHLPVGTDTYVAIALAEAGAKRTGALAAPPLWFGWSPHHMVLPGTITVRPEVLVEIGFDIVHSLSRHGFDKFVMINGHRIVNVTWLQMVGERAKRELGVQYAIFDPAFMSKSIADEMGWGPVGHAEEIEGSHMWHCYPDLVKMDRAVDNPHPHRDLYHVDPRNSGDTLCYVPSSEKEMAPSVKAAGGTTGEPSKASAEGGQRYHEHLVDRLAEVIAALRAAA